MSVASVSGSITPGRLAESHHHEETKSLQVSLLMVFARLSFVCRDGMWFLQSASGDLAPLQLAFKCRHNGVGGSVVSGPAAD
jgi:hypothetical protein